MAFRDQLKEEVEQANKNNEEQEELEYIELDGDEPYVKMHPTTMPTGTFPADEGNPIIRFPNSEYEDGRRDQGYLGLVFDDPGVYVDEEDGTDGTVILHNPDESTEYRIFNKDDDNTRVIDGEGVAFDSGQGQRIYSGEVVDEIDADRAVIVVSGTAAVSIAKKLDVNGATNADMGPDGQVNGGLIEYLPPDQDDDVRSRYARNPELRKELYGAEVGVMVTRRSEIDEDYAEMVENDKRNDMNWFSAFNIDTGEAISPTDEGEPLGYTYLEWRFDPSAGRLPDEDYEFVTEYVENDLATDEETILEFIEENSSELSDDPDTERMVGLIQSQAQ